MVEERMIYQAEICLQEEERAEWGISSYHQLAGTGESSVCSPGLGSSLGMSWISPVPGTSGIYPVSSLKQKRALILLHLSPAIGYNIPKPIVNSDCTF